MNNQHRALQYLAKHGECSSSEIAHHVGRNLNEASSMISRLVNKGHVTKRQSKPGSPIMLYSITDAGQKAKYPLESIRIRIRRYLAENPGSSTGEIAKGTGVLSSTVSTKCHEMERLGEVKRTDGGGKRRRWALLEAGEAMAALPVKRKPEPPRCPMMRAMPHGSALEQHYRQGMVDVRSARKRALRAITGGLGRAA